MISGTLNLEEYSKSSSQGRVFGCDAKHLFNCGVMNGRTEEAFPVYAGPGFSDCKFSNAVKTAAEKNIKYVNGVI